MAKAGPHAEDLGEAQRVVEEQLPAHVVDLPLAHSTRAGAVTAKRTPPRAVPNVRGMQLREAVRTLHRAGFRVHLGAATGSASDTWPHAGALLREGSLVRLVSDR
jgi:beta-lactam-binding protein with PASTA domain